MDTHTSSCDLIGQDFGKDVKWKWYGGGMGGDGAIYCVPLGHDRVLRKGRVEDTHCMRWEPRPVGETPRKLFRCSTPVSCLKGRGGKGVATEV